MTQAVPFDSMAADYDRAFSESAIGRHMRAAVWRRLDAAFRPGDRVLELNCGTGEDAIYLGRRGVRVLATDISAGMLDVTRAKVARAGLADVVQVERLDIRDLVRAVGDKETRRQGDKEAGSIRSSLSPGLPASRSGSFDG